MKKETSLSSDNADREAYRVAFLIAGFIQDHLSPDQHRELDDWVTASMENQRLFEELTDPAVLEQTKPGMERDRSDALLQKVKTRLQFTDLPAPHLFWRLWPYLAAACLVLITVLIWMGKMQRSKNSVQDKVRMEWTAKDVLPGGNRATLILADGTTRNLDSVVKAKG